MGAASGPVLTDDDLNDTDRAILNLFREGRLTPPLVAERLGKSREYASERLIRLREHGHAKRPAPGLYELVDDPREGDIELYQAGGEEPVAVVGGAETVDVQALKDDLEATEADLEDCREELAEARQQDAADAPAAVDDVDPEVVRDALDAAQRAVKEIPDGTPGRGTVQDVVMGLEREVGDE